MKLHHQLRLLITLMTATCLLAILLATLDFQYNVALHQRDPANHPAPPRLRWRQL